MKPVAIFSFVKVSTCIMARSLQKLPYYFFKPEDVACIMARNLQKLPYYFLKPMAIFPCLNTLWSSLNSSRKIARTVLSFLKTLAIFPCMNVPRSAVHPGKKPASLLEGVANFSLHEHIIVFHESWQEACRNCFAAISWECHRGVRSTESLAPQFIN